MIHYPCTLICPPIHPSIDTACSSAHIVSHFIHTPAHSPIRTPAHPFIQASTYSLIYSLTTTAHPSTHSPIHAFTHPFPLTTPAHPPTLPGRKSAVGVHGVFQHRRQSLDAPPAGSRGLFAPNHRTPLRTHRHHDDDSHLGRTYTPASVGKGLNMTFHVTDTDDDMVDKGNRRETFRFIHRDSTVIHPRGIL